MAPAMSPGLAQESALPLRTVLATEGKAPVTIARMIQITCAVVQKRPVDLLAGVEAVCGHLTVLHRRTAWAQVYFEYPFFQTLINEKKSRGMSGASGI